MKVEAKENNQLTKPEKSKSLFSRAIAKGEGSQLEKDEILDIIYWFRCIIGLVIGLLAGVLKITGYPVILSFAALIYTLSN